MELEEIKDVKIANSPTVFQFSCSRGSIIDDSPEKPKEIKDYKKKPQLKLREGEEEKLAEIKKIVKEKGIEKVEDIFLVRALRGKKYFLKTKE